MNSILRLFAIFLFSLGALAQQPPVNGGKPDTPVNGTKPESPAPPPKNDAAPASAATAAPPIKVDRAAAYYHYTLAHMYEEQMAAYGRSDLATKAIEEYRAAIDADPTSEYLVSALAELYAKTGRIRDAVVEAQDLLKKDPNNLEAHKLLSRIYLRSLGDNTGPGAQSVLKLAIEQEQEILKLQPDSMDDHLLLGRLYRLNNDLQKAENEFKAAVALQPDSEEAITTLAYFYNEEGDTSRAAKVLNEVPDSARSAKLYSALGYTYEQQKNYKGAITAYQKAVDLDHDNLDAIRGLAQNLLNDGQYDAALQQYRVLADANPEDAETFVRIADIYRKTGKYDLALESLKKASGQLQDSLEIPYSMASIYQAQGRYDEATRVLEDLLKKTDKPDGNYSAGERSNRAVFLERLGTIYRDNNQSQLAIDTFRKMIPLGDDNAERGYQEIIDTYRDNKQWQQATDAAKEATTKLPNDRGLKMVYAAQLADMGQADAGIQQVKALLKGTPDDREVYITLAQIYSRLKRWPEADQALDKADSLSTKPDEKQYVLFLRASMNERQKKYDEAEQEFRQVIASDPQNAVALNYLGYMLADRGVKLDEALVYIKKAVALDPANGAYLDSLGWAYYKLGKYDQAEEALTRASQHINSDPTVQDHLGDLYQKTGRLKLAALHWERALNEWNKTVSAEVDQTDVARVQKKLESAKVKLAKEDSGAENNK